MGTRHATLVCLHASKHLLYPICAHAAEQLRAQDSTFLGEAAGAAGSDTLPSGDAGDAVNTSSAAAEPGTPSAQSQGVSADEVTVEEGSEPATDSTQPPAEGSQLAAEDAQEALAAERFETNMSLFVCESASALVCIEEHCLLLARVLLGTIASGLAVIQ